MLSIMFWNIYYICHYKPLATVISNLHYPVYKIPFPEVMICNRNRLNWQRYNESKLKFLKPQHLTTLHEDVFQATVNAYDILRFGRYSVFKNLSEVYQPELLKDLDYVNFTQVVKMMSWKCHEIFSHCSCRNESHDCCDIFTARNSEKGMCLSFNTIESEEGALKHRTDPYYPWRTLHMGPKNGLRVRVHLREEWHSPFSYETKGILVGLLYS